MTRRWTPAFLLAMTFTMVASAQALRIAKVGDRIGALVTGLRRRNDARPSEGRTTSRDHRLDSVGSGGTIMWRAFSSLTAVTLRFPGSLAPGASRVAVVGPFNGWDPTVHPMARTKTGDWTITIYLPPGRVIYHFDVDGAVWLDPNDDGRIRNGWGSQDSVRRVVSPR